MRLLIGFLSALAFSVGISANPAGAATLNLDTSGQLLGASGVVISGKKYNVEFLAGSCIDVFNGCDDASDFAFSTEEEGRLATIALREQVWIDSVLGQFDSRPELTRGCTNVFGCSAFKVIGFGSRPDEIRMWDGLNRAGPGGIDEGTPIGSDRFLDLSDPNVDSSDSYTFAKFSAVTPVPLPLGGVLLLTGLAGLAAIRRRKKRAV